MDNKNKSEQVEIIKRQIEEALEEIENLKNQTSKILNVEQLEKFLDDHPYTIYRSRINGAYNGMYVKFRSPRDTFEYYQEIMEILSSNNFISNGQVFFSNEQAINTNFNLNYWNKEQLVWDFDWKEWERNMDERNIEKIPKIRRPTFDEKSFKKLDMTDIFLLRLVNKMRK